MSDVRTVRAQSLPGNPLLKFDGTAAPESLYVDMVDMRVEQSLGVPGRLFLRFHDDELALIGGNQFAIGTTVDVSLPKAQGQGTAMTPVFSGEITSVGLDYLDSSVETIVEAQDKSHRLAYGSQIRTFKNMKYSEVIAKICQETGVQSQISSQRLSGSQFKYLIQTGSNADFFRQIADATGTEWSMVAGKVVFGDRSETVVATLKAGEDLRRFRARFTSSGIGTSVEVRGWDSSTKRAIVGTDTGAVGGTFTGATTNGGLSAMRKSAKSFATGAKYINGSSAPLSKAEADAIAQGLAMRQASQQMTARGESLGAPEIAPGKYVQIDNVGPKLSGKYYVTSAEHTFNGEDGFITRFNVGGLQNNEIVDLLGGGTSGVFGPWAGAGLVVGVVTNNWDDEATHRVKVKFPTLTDTDESEWARVLTLSGGGAFGIQFWPEINDEVLVGFEQGDLRRPVVLGALWGGVDKPPLSAKADFLASDGKVTQRVIRSRSGHVVELNDNDDATKSSIKIKHKDGKSYMNLNDEKFEIWVNSTNPLHLKSGAAEIELKNGAIKITADTIEMTAKQTAKITANQKLEAKAANVEVNGSAGVKINASAKTEISGTAGVDIKGAMVKIN
jgi:uncharacterized protein involved in type VI secretion and phage assembly